MATPTTRRKQLGYALRYLREQAGLGQEEAGSHVGKRQGRIAEIESGQRVVSADDLATLLKVYRVTDQSRIDLLTELRRDNSHRGRWNGHRATYPEQFRMFVDLEEDADLIRTVGAEVIPGIVQCEEYVRAMYEERSRFENALSVEDFVRARLERHEILDKADAPELLVVMSESALRRMQGGAEVMRAQIDYLITLSRRPNTQIQVLPFRTRTYHGAFVSFRFTILRIPTPGAAGPLEVVYLDQLVDFRYLEDKTDITAHDRLWHRLSAAALSPEDTRAFMGEVARDY
ncbi:MAG TPA: helix-turn-helix transcriptional regulator [Actinophytocola sp.]|jgi:transcriptional regulator with XRE-family HTH domain|uniref:helix-turn-helix domain-containing protein n=1 Tax=Actinophytocola sp. TaxID=1872138 RepID=UPI002E005856|nr:helix-turn-helix transcriptional regulator [Actinophytocola sp.]